MPEIDELKIESHLPDGWLPQDAYVHVIARPYADAQCWQAIIPMFSIAGMGDSPREAAMNALELLVDYLELNAREGKDFSETYRPFGWRNRTALLRDAIVESVKGTSRRRAGRRSNEEYNVPLRAINAH